LEAEAKLLPVHLKYNNFTCGFAAATVVLPVKGDIADIGI